MTFNARIKIKETENEIKKKILNALKPEVNKYFRGVFNSIKSQLSDIVINSIRSSPEYDSLVSGNLKYEFGLPDSDSRVDAILNFWQKLEFDYKGVVVSGSQLKASFVLNMIPSDFSNVINSSAANFVTEKGQKLNWLEWLLLFGNQTIIKNYEVEFGPNPRSRTGQAVMRGVINGKWNVPYEFAGTIEDNWITRAIDAAQNDIDKLISNSIQVN